MPTAFVLHVMLPFSLRPSATIVECERNKKKTKSRDHVYPKANPAIVVVVAPLRRQSPSPQVAVRPERRLQRAPVGSLG